MHTGAVEKCRGVRDKTDFSIHEGGGLQVRGHDGEERPGAGDYSNLGESRAAKGSLCLLSMTPHLTIDCPNICDPVHFFSSKSEQIQIIFLIKSLILDAAC